MGVYVTDYMPFVGRGFTITVNPRPATELDSMLPFDSAVSLCA